MSPKFKLTSWQEYGHCQLTYKTKNANGESIYYCLQDNGERFGGIRLMRCSQDGEPSHEAKPKARIEFERPKVEEYDSNYVAKLKALCNAWIDAHEAEFGGAK